jgi:hypothetical protein
MNIFKILASGDGSIKEPNLSAFLAYLLNPKADHGLGSRFLQKILQPFIDNQQNDSKKIKINPDILKALRSTDGSIEDDKDYILDMSINSKFNVQVVLEKALKNIKIEDENGEINVQKGKTKEIVDIVIMITQHKEIGKEDVSYLFMDETPVALILLENKLKYSKTAGEQLLAQFNKSKEYLPKIMKKGEWEKWSDKIYTVFVSPATEELNNQFDNFKNKGNKNAIHITWNNLDTIFNKAPCGSIIAILLDILNESENGIISPINSYASDTIKALINFIKNDFSSDAVDLQRGGQKNLYKTLDELKIAKPELFSSSMWSLVKDSNKELLNHFSTIKDVKPTFTKSHTSWRYKGKRFSSISKRTKDSVIVNFRLTQFLDGDTKENWDLFKNLLKKYGLADINAERNEKFYYVLVDKNIGSVKLVSIVKVFYDLFVNALSQKNR